MLHSDNRFSMKCVLYIIFLWLFCQVRAVFSKYLIACLLILLEAKCLFSNIYTLSTTWYEHVNNMGQYLTWLVALHLLFEERCLIFLEFLTVQQRQIVFAFVTSLFKLQIPEFWKLLSLPCFCIATTFFLEVLFWVSYKGIFVKSQPGSLADDSLTVSFFHTLKGILCTLKSFRTWGLILTNRCSQSFLSLPRVRLLLVHLSLLILIQLWITEFCLLVLFWKKIYVTCVDHI